MTAYDAGLSWIASRVVKIAAPVVLVALVIAAVGIAMDSGIPVDASEESFAPPDLPAQQVADEVESVSGSITPLPLYVRGINTMTIEGIWWTDGLCTSLTDNYDKVSSISSLSSLVRSYNSGISLPIRLN